MHISLMLVVFILLIIEFEVFHLLSSWIFQVFIVGLALLVAIPMMCIVILAIGGLIHHPLLPIVAATVYLTSRFPWRKWYTRYRVVAGFRSPLFVLAYAPYLWVASIRRRFYPLSRIQERKV